MIAKYGDEGVGLVAKYGDHGYDFLSGLSGEGLRNVKVMDSPRLIGFLRGDTHLYGGDEAARTFFEDVVGRSPRGSFDRVELLDGREILYRAESRTGTSKIDIVDHDKRMYEKITFLEQ